MCIAGACKPKSSPLVSEKTRKLVLDPTDIAVIAGSDRWHDADIPFGRKSAGTVTLLMNFPSPFAETSNIAAAMLVLEPMPGEDSSAHPVRIELSRIIEPWNSAEVSYQRMPAIEPTGKSVLASTWGSRSLYVDVTEQVQRWREHRSDDRGLALTASASEARGVSYSLGLTGVKGPRLEVYIR
jgi:hypothetical protein